MRTLIPFLLLSCALATHAQPPLATHAQPLLATHAQSLSTTKSQSLQQLKQDMNGIASDATEGRFTGSSGYLKAAKYVAGQLKAAGLKTTFQAVPLIWDNYNGSTLIINDTIYPHEGGNFVVLQHSDIRQGKWAILKEMPDSAATVALLKSNAAGVILLPNQQQASDWETTVIRTYRFAYMHYAADHLPANAPLNIVMVSPLLAEKIKEAGNPAVNNPAVNNPAVNNLTINNTVISNPAVDFPAVHLKYKQDRINGYNVIATLFGTDKALNNQTIIAGAHLDHIGRVGHHIYNGANDDGSGCAALMAAARSAGQHPAKRPVIFVFYCGEELNLLGSRYFMEHPPIPIKDILMNINLEQVGSKHRSFPGVWAVGEPVYKEEFYQSGKVFQEADLRFTPADSLMGEISNTDGYSFIKKQVPSLLLSSGGFKEHHSTLDKIDLIDFEHLQKVGLLLTSLLTELGNR